MHFFDGRLNAATYDARTAARDLAETGAEGDTDFYDRLAQEMPGPVLDLGSGTGRVAFALAASGHRVTALERSEAMLEQARAKLATVEAASAKLVSLEHGDMQDFSLPDRYGLILIPFHGFQELLTPAAQRACLSAIRHHLEPAGVAVIHIFDPNLPFLAPEAAASSRRPDVRITQPENGNEVVVQRLSRENDPLHQLRTERWRLAELDSAGRVLNEETSILRLRWTYRFEMMHLFELEGLEVVSELAAFDGAPAAYARAQIWTVRTGRTEP